MARKMPQQLVEIQVIAVLAERLRTAAQPYLLPARWAGGRRVYGEDMTRYAAPLLIAATMYFMTLAPALAHGLSSVVATFILLLLALALVEPTLAELFHDHAVALQRLRQARSHPRQSHRSGRRIFLCSWRSNGIKWMAKVDMKFVAFTGSTPALHKKARCT
jgi:hypothetical protein